MNYSYPPLLYQRGDDSEDEEDDEDDGEDYESNSNALDENDPFQIQNIIG